ncbi:zinc-binding dehydrogenase [Bradyrhizobium manausense]
MKAVLIDHLDNGRSELVVGDIGRPEPGPQDLLVRVRCAGVNFADLYRAKQHFSASAGPEHAVAGLEMAGEVVATGSEVKGFTPSDRVMGLTTGTYAEYCLIHHSLVMPVPKQMSWRDAAATAATFMTAHDALITNGEMAPGEKILIQAASSGVGIAAVQIARYLGAGLVMGTSTSPAKLDRLREIGLQVGIDSKSRDFVKAVLDATDGHGADVIVENIGGETLPGDVACAAVKCRIVNVGRLGKWTAEVNLDEHSKKRIKLIGVSFRTRSVEEHADVARRAAQALLPAFETGELRPLVGRVYPLEEAAAAQDYMKSGKHFGKIVLEVA